MNISKQTIPSIPYSVGGGTGTLSSRTLQENPYSLNIDGNYDVEAQENLLDIEVSYAGGASKNGVRGWEENTDYTTTFFGTGTYPDFKTGTGAWISKSLPGYITVNTDHISFNDEVDGFCRLSLLEFQLMKMINNTTSDKQFYIVIELLGFGGTSNYKLNDAERNYILNHNFILYDSTRNDNASIKLRAIKDDEIDKYSFLVDSHIKNIVMAEYANSTELENAMATNGLLSELVNLADQTGNMSLKYNYYYENA